MNATPETPARSEQIIWIGHSSHLVNFGTYVLCGLFCWLIIWIGHSSHLVNFGTYVLYGLFCLLIIPIFIALWKWIENRCRLFEITTERIKVTRGVFSRQTEEVELYRVRDYKLVEPFWLRLFGLGTIVISTTDNTNQVVQIEAIPAANDLRDQLRKHVETCRERKGVRITEFE